jgi:site-specific DNA-methyltransferase (adenine-specific)
MKTSLRESNLDSACSHMTDSQIITGDALTILPRIAGSSVDCCVTSPRYNFGKNYGHGISDNTSMSDYFDEMYRLAAGLWWVIKPEGAVFLNIGTRATNPLHDVEVAMRFVAAGWRVQERIVWQKADDEHGHFTPITSKIHLNALWETVFLLTKTGKVPLDRLAIGVPFADKSNSTRWQHGQTLRCRGDIWMIPYPTITSRGTQRGGHEATFPRELVIRCLKLIEHGRTGLVVLDPCCGTGTAPAVAIERGHQGFGIELNPAYAAIASHRIATATPGPALFDQVAP